MKRMICSLSNETPEEPVISPSSGRIFEKRLIVKHLSQHEKDPISQEKLTPDMLIEIKDPPSLVIPRPPTINSVPDILKLLKDEWDVTKLDLFNTRQELLETRQKLNDALYQADAAFRVISRLENQLKETKDLIANATRVNSNGEVSLQQAERPQSHLQQQQQPLEPDYNLNEAPCDVEMVNKSKYDDEFVPKAEILASQLTAERKIRMKTEPEGFTSADVLATFQTIASHTGLHSTTYPGILCIDCRSPLIVTGGKDKNVVLFDKDKEEIIATLSGHTRPVIRVLLHPDRSRIISASEDATIKIWQPSDEQPLKHTLRVHGKPITDISLHPSGEYLLSSALDSWAITDISTGDLIRECVMDPMIQISTAQFHPDGVLFATGTLDGRVLIWDVKQKVDRHEEAELKGHKSAVIGMAFSENGYYLATCEDYCVNIWDLRDLQKNAKTILLDNTYKIKDLSFDLTGSYLALCGTDLRLYSCKNVKQGPYPRWSAIKILDGHKDLITGVRFGHNATFVTTVGLDRTLKIHSCQQR